jgi:hypothetical protein
VNKVWEKLSEADLANWQAAHDRWAERDAREWAASPTNRNLAQKLYLLGERRLSDAERGGVSPLGGTAVPAQNLKGRQ